RTPLIVIKEEKTWREALRFCRENHVDLVSVLSEEMQDWVGVVTQNAFSNVPSRVWIGLRHTCAQGFWFWVAGETICYQNWAPGNETRVEDCGNVKRTGAMLSDIMSSVMHFVLLFSAPLIVIKEEKTWREALRFCRQNHVELVSIESEEMQDWVGVVTQKAFSNVTSRVWIGLRHTCALGFWYWVAGETICYQNWAPGNGTGVEDCGDVERTGAMLSDKRTPLIVIKEEKTWREALWFCRQNHVDLVSVQSQEMQDWMGVVTQNAFTNVPSRVWIGLCHTCAQGFWFWVAGEPICYQNWAPGNGTGVEDCGDVKRTGAMLSD
ncbi:macrophage mannose receptor 1-like, partial [Clarias magur]